MAGPYYVDDGGDNSDGSTWAKAYTSLSALDDAVALAAGDIVYIGHNHVCQYAHAANRTITGPASGAPCVIISTTQGSNPPTYTKSATNQIDTTEGAYTLTFDGAFALYGIRLISGGHVTFSSDADEKLSLYQCIVAPPANGYTTFGATSNFARVVDVTIDLTADGAVARTNDVFRSGSSAGVADIIGMSFVNAAFRTGHIIGIDYNNGGLRISGADFSGFTNGTLCELVQAQYLQTPMVITNCLTAATWSPTAGSVIVEAGSLMITNTGPASAPTYLYFQTIVGTLVSSSSIYRTSGATVNSIACGWLCTTPAGCVEHRPFVTPWIYGNIAATGEKTFTLYITNDTADFDDDEVWLEVEYAGTAAEAIWSRVSDQRATILTTAAAQTDDAASEWNGAGPAFTFKQSLAVTATVNVTGQYRARVCIGKASIAAGSYFYIDPKVTVS